MEKKNLSQKELEALKKIRNIVVHTGSAPSVRELMIQLGYKSPRSASVLIEQLIKKGFLKRKDNKKLQFIKDIKDDVIHAQTVNVPLVGSIACGTPIFAEENIEAMFAVSTRIARPPHKYFFLKTYGNSMNKVGINNGDLVLIRQQNIAKEGDYVVALINDEATIKEIHFTNDTIILKPRSTNKQHKPIILTSDFLIQGVVINSISRESIYG